MMFSQKLIKHKFNSINGLQSTYYQLRQLPLTDNVLQIINSNNHWALISTMGCTNDTVKLYDSLYSSLSSGTIKTIASLFRFQSPTFTVKVMNVLNVAQQVGSQDFALYAIAFMTSLSYNEDPTIIKYLQEEMRDHLIKCFEKKELIPFPSKKRKVLKSEEQSETFNIYCTCWLPEDVDDMICCDKCDKWYHQSCIEAVVDKDSYWFCRKCQ